MKAITKKKFNLSRFIKTNILKEDLNKNLSKNIYINHASINSKNIKKNSIFVGVKGKKFDGNLYANEAIQNNANLAITNKKSKNPKIIFRQNPLNTFNKLSFSLRKSLNANNIVITGSAGKHLLKI